MRILNQRLDEVQELPRNLSEPRLKYFPSPDLRPEVLQETDEVQRSILMRQIETMKETG